MERTNVPLTWLAENCFYCVLFLLIGTNVFLYICNLLGSFYKVCLFAGVEFQENLGPSPISACLIPLLPVARCWHFSARKWPQSGSCSLSFRCLLWGSQEGLDAFESTKGRWLWGLGGLQFLPEAPQNIIRAYREVLSLPALTGLAPNEGGWAGLLLSQKPQLPQLPKQIRFTLDLSQMFSNSLALGRHFNLKNS